MAKANAAEPSMEEILASIRRIISDEVAPVPQPVAPAVRSAAPAAETVTEDDLDSLFNEPSAPDSVNDAALAFDEADEEPMELDDSMELLEEEPEIELIEGIPDEPDVTFADPEPEPVKMPPPVFKPDPIVEAPRYDARPPMNAHSRPVAPSAIMSSEAGSHVSATFASLATTVLSSNTRTIEDLVQDMLRPMLKDWLDENLPNMVERLVRAEIERVSRGGRP